jgi:hypothetical protein
MCARAGESRLGAMNEPIGKPHGPDTLEAVEDAGLLIEFAAAGTVRAIEIAAAVLLALLVCPPLLILAVVVIAPLVAIAVVVGLVVAVLAVPWMLVRHLHHHERREQHTSLIADRLRRLRMRHA